MKLTYSQHCDFLIPNLALRGTVSSIGHYGRQRKNYLREHRPILFNKLVLSEQLYEHCAEIETAARKRVEVIVAGLAHDSGVNEQLKADNPMEWVRRMNAFKAQAEEIVLAELVYV